MRAHAHAQIGWPPHIACKLPSSAGSSTARKLQRPDLIVRPSKVDARRRCTVRTLPPNPECIASRMLRSGGLRKRERPDVIDFAIEFEASRWSNNSRNVFENGENNKQ